MSCLDGKTEVPVRTASARQDPPTILLHLVRVPAGLSLGLRGCAQPPLGVARDLYRALFLLLTGLESELVGGLEMPSLQS